MNTISEAVVEYLQLRRSLGFKLIDEERMLRRFAEFMLKMQAPYITQQLALAWAQQPVNAKPVTHANRLCAVRAFARYRQAADPHTEIPAKKLLSANRQRPKPYLYSDQQLDALLQAARNMAYCSERTALLPLTYYCLFGLLRVSGLRLGEVCNLNLRDLDVNAAVLTVRNAKHDRTRLVPLHESTSAMLADYVDQRHRHWSGHTVSDYLFVSSNGNRLHRNTVENTFRKLSCQIGLRELDAERGPRLHDIRHTFSVRTLENWYRQGDDPEKLLPILSTYLGHVRVCDTYWYLELSPGLMNEAMKRMQRRWESRP